MGEVRFALLPHGSTPDGMVRVPGGAVSGIGQLPAFFIDKYEVTNKAFKRFVDAGGYRAARYWPPSMTTHGRTVSWEEAVAEFRDTTGRPGPSTWELGTYPEGQDDWPVRGVSWYEATAYAQFAGKSLPTVHHWRLAAAMGIHSAILEWSNFSGKGPARVGEYLGIGPYGTFDMAGNVKEWCANAVRDRRYIMGGAWNEPNYQYQQADARLPEDRSDNNGLRLVTLPDPAAVPAAASGPVERLGRDYRLEKPVSDDLFARVRPAVFIRRRRSESDGGERRCDVGPLARRARVVQRGVRRGACHRVSVPAKERAAALSDCRLLPACRGTRARLVPAGRNGLPGLSREVGARPPVPDVQGHVRAPAEGAAGRAQCAARHSSFSK